MNTQTGHVGFDILDFDGAEPTNIEQSKLADFADSGAEVGVASSEHGLCVPSSSRTRVDEKVSTTGWEPLHFPGRHHVLNQKECHDTLQLFVGSLPAKRDLPGNVDGCASAQDEEGVCQGDRQSLCGHGRGVDGPWGGSPSRNLEAGETSEEGPSPQPRLEESLQGHPEGHLHGHSGAGLGQVSGGPSLGRLEPLSVSPGNRAVGGRSEEPDDRRDRGGEVSGTRVRFVPSSDDSADKPADTPGFLGLHPVPSVSGDAVHDLCRSTSGNGAEGREGEQSQGRPRVQDEGPTRSGFRGLVDSCLRAFRGSPTCRSCERGERNRGEAEPGVHESQPSRGRQDHQGASGSSSETSHPGEVSSRVSDDSRTSSTEPRKGESSERVDSVSDVPSTPLEPAEIDRRIRAGNARRKIMKRGVVRRLMGNVKTVVSSVFLASAVFAVASVSCIGACLPSAQPDLLEIFGGHAEVSMRFSKWGWQTMEPCDVLYGTDLLVEENRKRILEHISRLKPRLVLVSFPCRLWGPLTRLTYASAQERRRLLKLRNRETPFLQLTEQVFELQMREDRDALGENPLPSEAFKTKPIQNILNHPDVYVGVGHGCRFGIKNAKTGEPLLKPTLWFSSSIEICDELSLRCNRHEKGCFHEHGTCMGGKQITQHAGRYTREIAVAIHKGLVRTLKRKDPSRIRQIIRMLGNRLRNKEGDKTESRWSKRVIESKLREWQSCYAVDNPALEDPSAASGNAVKAESGTDMQDMEALDVGLNEEGISFDVPKGRKLSTELRRSLRRLHCNLGHPGSRDFERFLRLGGAKQELVEASSWLRCMTCLHGKKPRIHRTVNPPPSGITFGDEICVDCFLIHDVSQTGHWFLSILDRATSFHMVGYVDDHSPQTLRKVLDDSWCVCAGIPCRISIDLEGVFASQDFWKQVSEWGCPIIPIAGTAHWQAGKIERHNQTIKTMMEHIIRHGNVQGLSDMKKVAREAVQAKNELTREHGWSPNILVFGREPRAYGEFHREGNPHYYHPNVGTPGTDVAKHVKYRYRARIAFMKHQVKQMLNRSLEQRTRSFFQPEQGQMVFLWRHAKFRRKQHPASNWIGPGFVVGVQGTNAWVTCGGRCFLVASEHLRLAQGEEEHFGSPEAQQALAMFRRLPKEATYEDLTKQKEPPTDDPMIVDDDFLEDLLGSDGEQGMEVDRGGNVVVPQDIRELSKLHGWTHDRFGNPVRVDRNAVRYTMAQPQNDGAVPRFRTTWGYMGDHQWKCLEKDVDWVAMDEPQQLLPETPVAVLVTVFGYRKRKDICLDSVPDCIKRVKHGEHEVLVVSKQKQQRMLDKEIPFHKIPPKEKPLYDEAIAKEWKSWIDHGTVEMLNEEESAHVMSTQPQQVLRSRMVLRNKNAGAFKSGLPLPTKAKARLCVLGQHSPGVAEGNVVVDSPTVQKVSTFYFLNCIVSWGWLGTWRVGDVSCAFLQGNISEGKPLYMKPPPTGLPVVHGNVVFRLRKSVYGLPEAPKAWYDALCGIVESELGFVKSCLDQAFFRLYNSDGKVCALLITHVDDLMMATDGSVFAEEKIEQLRRRLPFGQWKVVQNEVDGIEYCGKEIRICRDGGEAFVDVSQAGFIQGRLEEIEIRSERKKLTTERATSSEQTDYRSTVGSLQWLCTQTRPDLSFEVNQLQKRVNDLRVEDLKRANRAVREVKQNPFSIKIRNLGENFECVVFHDAGLYNSVGVELSEQETDDLLLKSSDKKLVYSQKGAVVGFVSRGDTRKQGVKINFNLLDWKSATNRRVVESSFAAETQAALLGRGLAQYVQSLHIETMHGIDTMLECDDQGTQEMIPTYMITDCKSLYDCVHKQGQHVSDRGSIVSIVLLRQMCETCVGDNGPASRTQLLWVPTSQQLADGLTKGGQGHAIRAADWRIQLHGESLKRLQSKRIGSV